MFERERETIWLSENGQSGHRNIPGNLVCVHDSLAGECFWQPANFHGVRIGKSSSSDVIRLFGKPQDTYNPKMNMTILFRLWFPIRMTTSQVSRTYDLHDAETRSNCPARFCFILHRKLYSDWMVSQFGNAIHQKNSRTLPQREGTERQSRFLWSYRRRLLPLSEKGFLCWNRLRV